MLNDEDKAELQDYLTRNGYASIDEWAEDSDFTKVGDTWWDDDNPTNPEEYLLTLIRELGL